MDLMTVRTAMVLVLLATGDAAAGSITFSFEGVVTAVEDYGVGTLFGPFLDASVAPGTSMAIYGIADSVARAAIIDYLKTLK